MSHADWMGSSHGVVIPQMVGPRHARYAARGSGPSLRSHLFHSLGHA